MFNLGVSYGEKAARSIIVYVALLILLRLVGKRGMAQLNTFDLVVALLLTNAVQNAVIGNDLSVTGGLFSVVILLLFDGLLVRQAVRWRWFARLVQGSPTILARDGRYDVRVLRRLGLTPEDVDLAVHTQGGDKIEETSLVRLEPGGSVLVRLRESKQAADKSDIAKLDERLQTLETRFPR
jgi:uncharacterized membrane protein YcaP (DUF421 family)